MLYSPYHGSRHLIIILVFLGLNFIGFINDKKFKLNISALGAVVLILMVFSWNLTVKGGYMYALPQYENDLFSTTPIDSDANLLTDAFTVDSAGVNWDNTVMFLLDGTSINYLYSLPAGAGIQIVHQNYIMQEEGGFASRYAITTNSDYFRDWMFYKGYAPLVTAQEYILYERF